MTYNADPNNPATVPAILDTVDGKPTYLEATDNALNVNLVQGEASLALPTFTRSGKTVVNLNTTLSYAVPADVIKIMVQVDTTTSKAGLYLSWTIAEATAAHANLNLPNGTIVADLEVADTETIYFAAVGGPFQAGDYLRITEYKEV